MVRFVTGEGALAESSLRVHRSITGVSGIDPGRSQFQAAIERGDVPGDLPRLWSGQWCDPGTEVDAFGPGRDAGDGDPWVDEVFALIGVASAFGIFGHDGVLDDL